MIMIIENSSMCVIVEVLTPNRTSKMKNGCSVCVCVCEGRKNGERSASCFYIFFIYLRVDVDVCIMRLYICVWIKQTNQRTSSTSIVCICISRLLAHFSLPSFFSFVKRTHTRGFEEHQENILDQILFLSLSFADRFFYFLPIRFIWQSSNHY